MKGRTKERRPTAQIDAGSSQGPAWSRLRSPVRSFVEPLVVERRRQVELEERARRMRLAKTIGALVAVTALVVGVLYSPLLSIGTFTVKGTEHLASDSVVATSGLRKGTPLVAADIGKATAALRADPWIAYARIRRSYPRTIFIDVAEERPVLVIRTSHGSALISENGRIVEYLAGTEGKAPESASSFSVVVATYEGPLASGSRSDAALPGRHVSEPVGELVRLARHLTPAMRQRLAEIVTDDKSTIVLKLNDGSSVLLGPAEDMTAKLSALESVLEQVQLDCLAQIDVRNPVRATISRTPGCKLRDK